MGENIYEHHEASLCVTEENIRIRHMKKSLSASYCQKYAFSLTISRSIDQLDPPTEDKR